MRSTRPRPGAEAKRNLPPQIGLDADGRIAIGRHVTEAASVMYDGARRIREVTLGSSAEAGRWIVCEGGQQEHGPGHASHLMAALVRLLDRAGIPCDLGYEGIIDAVLDDVEGCRDGLIALRRSPTPDGAPRGFLSAAVEEDIEALTRATAMLQALAEVAPIIEERAEPRRERAA